MKMVKKLLVCSLFAAVLFAFSGCKRDSGGSDFIEANLLNATVNYTNEGQAIARDFVTLLTPHADGVCYIENNINPIESPTSNLKTNGVMGFIFNIKVDEATEKYSFSIAGVRYNQYDHKIQAYVESFTNVDKDKLEEELPTGTKATGMPTYADKFGFNLPGDYNDYISDGKIKVWIEVIANDGLNATGRDGAKNTYTVNFYKEDPKRKTVQKSSDNKYPITYEPDGGNVIATATIAAANVNNKIPNDSNDLAKMQADMGYYANVQPGQNLKGKWKIEKCTKEAEEIAE